MTLAPGMPRPDPLCDPTAPPATPPTDGAAAAFPSQLARLDALKSDLAEAQRALLWFVDGAPGLHTLSTQAYEQCMAANEAAIAKARAMVSLDEYTPSAAECRAAALARGE